MAATIVQSAEGTSTLATVTASFSTTPTNGNVIVLAFAADDYNGTPNTGWTQSTGMEQQTFHGGYIWWKIASGGSNSFQYTIGSATNSSWVLLEISGLDATPYDVSQGQSASGSVGNYTTSSITPTAGSRFLVAALGSSNSSGDMSADLTGWTNSFTHVRSSGPVSATGTRDNIGVATLAVTANGSTSYNTNASFPFTKQSHSGMIIAFKVASGGSSNISGTSNITFSQSGLLKGKGKLAGPSTVTFSQSINLKGKGKLAGPSNITFSQNGNLKGRINITGSSSVVFSPTSSLKGVGKLAGTSSLTFTASLNTAGFSFIQGNSTLTFSSLAALTGQAKTLEPSFSEFIFTSTGTLRGLVNSSGSTNLTFNTSSLLKATGKLAGTSNFVFSLSGRLIGASSVVGTSTLTFTTNSSIKAINYGVGSSSLLFSNSAVLSANANKIGSSTITFSPTGNLFGKASVVGTTTFTFTSSGVVRNTVLIAGNSNILFTSSAEGSLYKLPYEDTNTTSNFIYSETVDVATSIYSETIGYNPNIIYEED